VRNFFEKKPNWLVQLIAEGIMLYLVEHVDAFFNRVAKLLKNVQWQSLLSVLLFFLNKPVEITLFFSLILFLSYLLFLGFVASKGVENYKWADGLVRFGVKAGLVNI